MITARTILRGAITRTLPGFYVGFAVLMLALRVRVPLAGVGTTALLGVAATAGGALVLGALRRRLRSDAGVAGSRAFLVGVGAFAVTITAGPFVRPHGLWQYPFVLGCGALLSVAVFFPWLGSETVSPPESIPLMTPGELAPATVHASETTHA
jgi:hypothetical protein